MAVQLPNTDILFGMATVNSVESVEISNVSNVDFESFVEKFKPKSYTQDNETFVNKNEFQDYDKPLSKDVITTDDAMSDRLSDSSDIYSEEESQNDNSEDKNAEELMCNVVLLMETENKPVLTKELLQEYIQTDDITETVESIDSEISSSDNGLKEEEFSQNIDLNKNVQVETVEQQETKADVLSNKTGEFKSEKATVFKEEKFQFQDGKIDIPQDMDCVNDFSESIDVENIVEQPEIEIVKINTETEKFQSSLIKDGFISEVKNTNGNSDEVKPDLKDKMTEDVNGIVEEVESGAETNNQDYNQSESNDDTFKLTVDNISEKSEFLNSDKEIIFNKLMDGMVSESFSKKAGILKKAEVLPQLNEGLKDLSVQNPKVNIVLKPDNLGRIVVELQKSEDGLIAKFAVSTSEVQELLNKNLDNLRTTLTTQGVNVNSLVVKVSNSGETGNNFLDFQNQGFNQNSQTNSNKNKMHKYNFMQTEEEGTVEDAELSEESTQSEQTVKIGRIDYRI